MVEASALYGESADFVARLRAPHESDVHNVLDRLFEAGIVAGSPQVLRFAPSRWERSALAPSGGRRRSRGRDERAQRCGRGS